VKSPRKIYFDKAEDVPNSPLPVLIFRSVLNPQVSGKAARFRQAFKQNAWTGLWTDTIYDYTHFHSNAHEVLGIAEGKVSVKLGGDDGRLFRLKAGDMLVLPAGIGHRRIGDDKGLKVIGAYPPGQSHFTMKRKGRTVPKVPLPPTDPFYGEEGPLVRIWSAVGTITGSKRRSASPAGPAASN
jgi:uncharacterized protein YjlB